MRPTLDFAQPKCTASWLRAPRFLTGSSLEAPVKGSAAPHGAAPPSPLPVRQPQHRRCSRCRGTASARGTAGALNGSTIARQCVPCASEPRGYAPGPIVVPMQTSQPSCPGTGALGAAPPVPCTIAYASHLGACSMLDSVSPFSLVVPVLTLANGPYLRARLAAAA